MRGHAWRPSTERHEATSWVFPRVPVSPPPPATASRALIHRSSPFRPQMEPKKTSAQHQPHAMEPKKSSPRRTGAATGAANDAEDSPLSSLFYPPAPGVRFLNLDVHLLFDVMPPCEVRARRGFFFSLTLLFTTMQMGSFACRRVTSYIYLNFPFPFLLSSQRFDAFWMWIRPFYMRTCYS